jgi:tetratricopeptide (TPR) repeat protein
LAHQTRETLQKGLALLQASGDRRELGYGFLYLEEWQPSIEARRKYLDQALTIFTELHERKGTARVQRELGHIELSQGNFQQARQFFYASLEMHRELANQRDTASSLGDIAYIHWIMGNYPEALQSLTECLEIVEECNDKMGLAFTYSLFGTVYGAMKDYARAKEFVWKRFAISKEAGNNIGCAFSLMSIAECELMEGNPEKANHLVKQSYPYYAKIGEHFPEEGWYYRVLGEAECSLGNLKEGRHHLRQALIILVADNRLVQNTHTMIGIARYFEQMGQKERAFELLGLALHHPGSWQWVRERAAALVEKLKQEIPPEVANAALERGRNLDLADTVMALLAELEEDDIVLTVSI